MQGLVIEAILEATPLLHEHGLLAEAAGGS